MDWTTVSGNVASENVVKMNELEIARKSFNLSDYTYPSTGAAMIRAAGRTRPWFKEIADGIPWAREIADGIPWFKEMASGVSNRLVIGTPNGLRANGDPANCKPNGERPNGERPHDDNGTTLDCVEQAKANMTTAVMNWN